MLSVDSILLHAKGQVSHLAPVQQNVTVILLEHVLKGILEPIFGFIWQRHL